MPTRTKTSKIANRSVDDLGISGMLDWLAGCHPGGPAVPWSTWKEMFADYRMLRADFLARFPPTPDDPHEPWIEGAARRWRANPKAAEFSETYAEKIARQMAEQVEDAREAIADAKAAGTWPQNTHGAALAGAGEAEGEAING